MQCFERELRYIGWLWTQLVEESLDFSTLRRCVRCAVFAFANDAHAYLQDGGVRTKFSREPGSRSEKVLSVLPSSSEWRSENQGKVGGERGIRTLEGLLTLTPLAGVRLRPLGHLSGGRNHNEPEGGWQRTRPKTRQTGKVSRGALLDSSVVDRSPVPWPFLIRSKISSR